MADQKTHWYLKPLNDQINEQVAALLAEHGISSAESEISSIKVDGKTIHNVYLVEYWIITIVEHSDIHRKHIRVYRQVGNGRTKPWLFQNSQRSNLSRTKSVRRMKKDLAIKKRN